MLEDIENLEPQADSFELKPTNPKIMIPFPEKIKQVIIIRKDLNMRKGKMISMGAHASLSCILQLLIKTPILDDSMTEYHMMLDKDSPVNHWISHKFTKITVSVNSEEELLNIYKHAKEKKLLCSLIQDAGDTEFHGIPTYTSVAIGPDYSSHIDEITGNLPLL